MWRIDGTGANAVDGRVVWAPLKSAWNSTMYALALIAGPLYFSWSGLIVFLGLSYVTLLFGHSLGMHRRLIHRSFAINKGFERFLVWLGVLVGMSGPFGILRIHDVRDWAQREESCHDFFAHRRGLWVDAFWQLHCRFQFDKPPTFTIEPEFARDPWYRVMQLTWPLHQLLLAVILYLLGGASWAVWGVAVRVAVSVTSHWVVTYLAHNPGPGQWLVKNAAVQASNLNGWGLLTHGECWHNNHHAFPESARLGLGPGQLDPGYSALKILQRIGLVTSIGLPRPIGERDDLALHSVAVPIKTGNHRIRANHSGMVLHGTVRFSAPKSAWFSGMALAAVVGGAMTFCWSALELYLATTATVLLLGHSLGSHRKLIHDSYACPKWLEYFLVYCGVQVGLTGPLGLLSQHELRDYAQRQRSCHAYLRHGNSFWRDGWWQLHCELRLDDAPILVVEPNIANDSFYRFLQRTWMAQQIPPAVIMYLCGGWGFVFWGVCARVATGVLGHWLIGYYAHNRGGEHFIVDGAAVQGRNIRFTSLLTMGESWHNNHHAFPGSARLGLFAGEWDPGWWLLMVMRKLGLAWNITEPSHLPIRPELHPTDEAAGALWRVAQTSRNEKPTLISVRRIAVLCADRQARDRTQEYILQGPAALLSANLTQRLVGSRVVFKRGSVHQRLALSTGNERITGLPALCVSVASRNLACRALAICMAPFAVAFENTRLFFDLPA